MFFGGLKMITSQALMKLSERLNHLREVGDTPYAFTFKTNFTELEAQRANFV